MRRNHSENYAGRASTPHRLAHLAARIRKIALQDPFFSSQNAQREGRKAFVRKWRFRHRAVADSLEAGDRLFSFTRLPLSQWKSARTTRSSVCTKNSSDGSRLKPFCHPPTPPRCCSGRCSLQDRSTCARWMGGRRFPQNPLISRLTLPPETIPSCYRRTRH